MDTVPSRTRSYRYEQRLILFLDFLGFREIVSESAADNAKLQRLIRAYDLVAELRDDKDLYKSKRVSQFSDSIVVSYLVEETSAVFDLITDISLTVVDLANWGYLVRGAVTVGPLLHDKKHLVGPAMVKAYEMESQKARFPRIIVDPAVITAARTYRVDRHTPDEEESYVRSYLAKDDDDWNFIDYISFDAVIGACGIETEDYGDYLMRIGDVVGTLLHSSDERICEKGLWLHKYYLTAIATMRKASMAFRREYPELCADVADLPKFLKLARQAKARQRVPQSSSPLKSGTSRHRNSGKSA